MRVRSETSLIAALKTIPRDDEQKEANFVGERLGALFDAFNIQGQVALVKKDDSLADKDFALQFSKQIVSAVHGGYNKLNETLKKLAKGSLLGFTFKGLTVQSSEQLIDSILTPAIFLAVKFPDADLNDFPSAIEKNIGIIKRELKGSISLDDFFKNIFNPEKINNFFDPEVQLTQLTKITKALNSAAQKLSAIFVQQNTQQPQGSKGTVMVNRLGINEQQIKIAAALKRLFKAGGPLETFQLAAAPQDLDSSLAANAFNKLTEELQKTIEKGYRALIKELPGHLREAPSPELIQDDIAPWIYLALSYPDKKWEDLKDHASALKQARITLGATDKLDEAIRGTLGPANTTADLAGLNALLKKKTPAAAKQNAGNGAKPSTAKGVQASSAAHLHLYDPDEEKQEPGISDAEVEALVAEAALTTPPPKSLPEIDSNLQELEEEFKRIQANCEKAEKKAEFLSQLELVKKIKSELALIQGDLDYYSMLEKLDVETQIKKVGELNKRVKALEAGIRARIELGDEEEKQEDAPADVDDTNAELEKPLAGASAADEKPKPLPELKIELSEIEEKATKLSKEVEGVKNSEKLNQLEDEFNSLDTQLLIVILSLELRKEDDLDLYNELSLQATALQKQKLPALLLTIKEKRFELIKAGLQAQIQDLGAIELSLKKISLEFSQLSESEQKDSQKLSSLNGELLLPLKKVNEIIEWWDKFNGEKLNQQQLLEVNSKKALTHDSANTMKSTLTALQTRIQELMKTALTANPGTMSNLTIEVDDEETEAEEDKYADRSSPLTLQEIVGLTNHYRKMSYLALHSEYDFVNSNMIYQTYKSLQAATTEYCAKNKITKEVFTKLLNNFLPKDPASFNKEKRDLEKPQGQEPQTIYHFGKSCKLVKVAQVDETIKSILIDHNFAGDPNSSTFSQPLKEKDEARITELDFDGLKAASVERFRQEQNGKYSFISQSHLPRSVTDPSILLPWACTTLNRFFASAPSGTGSVKLEDGYSPQQFAALVSYCDFMGHTYNIGSMQKLRLLADKLLAENKIDAELHKQLTHFQTVTLTPELEALVKQDKTDWREWASQQQNSAFSSTHWQAWLDSPGIQEKYPGVPPLGKIRHDELLNKYDSNDPNLRSRHTRETSTARRTPFIVISPGDETAPVSPFASLSKSSFLSKRKAPSATGGLGKGSANTQSQDHDTDTEEEDAQPFARLSKKDTGNKTSS